MDHHEHQHLFDVGGAHLSRLEDLRLIKGEGCYAADWNLPKQAHAVFLRADHAHAKIVSINTDAARKAPGVLGVYTGEDAVSAGQTQPLSMLTFAGKDGKKALIPKRPALAHGHVRFVGDAVAMVVAETALQAQDAAELIEVEYEDLPVVIAPEAALAPGAPQLHDNVPGNLVFEQEAGDAAAVEAAFAEAAHVTKLKLDCTRVVPNPMEPRACLADYDAKSGVYTLHSPVQGINMMRMQLVTYTGVPEDKIKVVARDVGGGFGQRSIAYPEYCSVMMAAKALGRPVKWVSTRSESFLSDSHGRANYITAELALDKDGTFLGMRLDWIADLGAYLHPAGPVSPMRNPVTCLNGVYKTQALFGRWRVVLTNTSPVSAYRGAARPEMAYTIERLVDEAAAQMKIDPAEIRRRNFIPSDAFPYKTPTGSVYDIADFPAVLDKALKLADVKGFAKRRAETEKRGLLRGLGLSTVIENSGAGMFPKDEILLEVAADGKLTAYSISHSQGQGHETTFAQIIGDALEIPAEHITLRQGIAEKGLIGNHTGGSRTIVGAGTVCHLAAKKLIEIATPLAAEQLGVEPSQVAYAKGEFTSKESKKTITLGDLAAKKPLSATGEGKFGSTFPNGCHIAEVEIDPQTGVTQVVSYVTVDDCGTVINHTIVEGQMHGAVAQGWGQIFGENVVYDPDTGQLLTGSFMDYAMPKAGWIKDITIAEHTTFGTVSPLGVKGMGESGCTASLGALTNAVMDALRPLGVPPLDMPLTAHKLWQAITAANKKGH
ncbi:MAG: xanthine dehydrogenase family protein molybdopterin-binding subunit [Betaproteobacteria bacterium]|jgi:carbon-monoxide dehydrogenase large subunit|nr:xanthine dehydrogenase family protein molybdopterin-binding subunit [Betaproteobacteria bacterium]MDH5342610.1 xanthine dehydrogenase family protein molybdopterin-binding subunit [Betaproteobacteria bacterium]